MPAPMQPPMPAPMQALWPEFTYYPHQVHAVQWMKERELTGTPFEGTTLRGGLLADDMGLGKTIEITGLIVENPVPATLLVVPAALIGQWTEVLSRAGLRLLTAGKGSWETISHGHHYDVPTVHLINYEKLYTSCFTLLVGSAFDRIILDEAHRIRNATGSAAVVCGTIKARYHWAVTGTPVVNSLSDVASLFRFIGIKRKSSTWEPAFRDLAAAITLRRSIDDMRGLIADVPPAPVFHEVELSFHTEEEEEFYRGIQGTIESSVFKHDTHTSMLLALMRLRQISVHPQVYISSKRREIAEYSRPDWDLPVTKFEAVRRLLTEEADGGHKYIFICHFKEEIELLRRFLKENRLVSHVFSYDGSMDKTARNAALSLAKRSKGPTALLLQIQAGGVGLNLQEFDRVIFLSSWWTSALMEQAVARACRMGQKKVVHVYNFVLAEEKTANIDRKILGAVRSKKAISDRFFAMCCCCGQGGI